MTLAQVTPMFRLTIVLVLSGCVGDLVELTPGSAPLKSGDMAQTQAADLTSAGSNDGGAGGNADMAQAAALVHFDPTIQADIDSLGCAASSCHGGTQVPLLVATPISATDKTNNYDHFKAEAMMGAMSNVLVKNLAGSGVTHTGGSNFASTQDPIYQRWLAWINQGNPQ